jgi:hypothetical protein
MLFKTFALIAVLIPIILFLRSMFFRKDTRLNERFKEFKKQSNSAVTIFLVLIGCAVVFSAIKLAWTWL